MRSCLTNDTKFSDLLVLRTKMYEFKLVYFFLGHSVYFLSFLKKLSALTTGMEGGLGGGWGEVHE